MVYFTITDPNLCTRFGLNTIRIVTYNRIVNKKRNSESMEDNIDKIRKDAVAEIKEKAKKNHEYLHPTNKERQEDMKKLKFANGYEFTCWMQQNGVMKNPTNIVREENRKACNNAGCKNIRELNDKMAQKLGYKDFNDYRRNWRYSKGESSPMSENQDCPSWFGVFIGENYVIQTFDNPIKMSYGNPGFDWLCKRGEKIDRKGRCLDFSKIYDWSGWAFPIRYNNIADWFILSAWDNRDSLTPLHVWMFHKDDIIRGEKFWMRDCITITNNHQKLIEFEEYEITNRLEKLKKICDKKR